MVNFPENKKGKRENSSASIRMVDILCCRYVFYFIQNKQKPAELRIPLKYFL
jgi:hypothetical protein